MCKVKECTLFGKNLKPINKFNSSKPLPLLNGPNQEIQLDYAGPLLDEAGAKFSFWSLSTASLNTLQLC